MVFLTMLFLGCHRLFVESWALSLFLTASRLTCCLSTMVAIWVNARCSDGELVVAGIGRYLKRLQNGHIVC